MSETRWLRVECVCEATLSSRSRSQEKEKEQELTKKAGTVRLVEQSIKP